MYRNLSQADEVALVNSWKKKDMEHIWVIVCVQT